jgi:hypothetical protein
MDKERRRRHFETLYERAKRLSEENREKSNLKKKE